jgi:hypothetical protein
MKIRKMSGMEIFAALFILMFVLTFVWDPIYEFFLSAASYYPDCDPSGTECRVKVGKPFILYSSIGGFSGGCFVQNTIYDSEYFEDAGSSTRIPSPTELMMGISNIDSMFVPKKTGQSTIVLKGTCHSGRTINFSIE